MEDTSDSLGVLRPRVAIARLIAIDKAFDSTVGFLLPVAIWDTVPPNNTQDVPFGTRRCLTVHVNKHTMSHMELIEPSSAQLGIALKQVLKDVDMTQDDLANQTGIPRNTLNRKINGGVFKFDELTQISRAVKRPLSKIIAIAESRASSGESVALADEEAKS